MDAVRPDAHPVIAKITPTPVPVFLVPDALEPALHLRRQPAGRFLTYQSGYRQRRLGGALITDARIPRAGTATEPPGLVATLLRPQSRMGNLISMSSGLSRQSSVFAFTALQ